MSTPTLVSEFLADSFAIEFEGKKYTLRQPEPYEEGKFSEWLEQEAYNAIARRTYQTPTEQREDRKELNESVTVGDYEYNGPLCVRACNNPKGVAKMIEIVCREQGMTGLLAKQIVISKLKEIAISFVSNLPGAKQEDIDAHCIRLGFPAGFIKVPVVQTESTQQTEARTSAEPSTPSAELEPPPG